MQGTTVQRLTDNRSQQDGDRPWLCPRDASCPSPQWHDRRRGYLKGCRSGAALADNAEESRRWRAGERPRLVPAIGPARRLQALVRLGYSLAQLGARLHVTREQARRYAVAYHPHIFSTTAARIEELWIELSETDPPTSGRADRIRREAAAKDWQPVEAWDTTDIDDPRAKPYERRPIDVRREEAARHREEVARRTRARQSAETIAEAVGIAVRTVQRIRSDLAEAS